MAEPRVRLLYPKGTETRLIEAGMRGVKRFERFGIKVEHAIGDKKGMEGVTASRFLERMVSAKGAQTIGRTDFSNWIEIMFGKRTIIGMALTNAPLIYNNEGVIGISEIRRGAVVSLSRIGRIPEQDIREAALEQAVKHELGHVLGSEGHCTTAGCIMQENKHFVDFIADMVRARLDFCRRCTEEITLTANRPMIN
ncbi:hypothetical protein HZC07_01950 [Candidatus Micrarchaeota archaeon]|nr:hypothetical protein [Candidatus Micrarchaeota archaeon]